MWTPSSSDGAHLGQVTARVETTPALGTSSISVSQQQAPKKFAPVVAPKPKFNPYKHPGDPAHADAGEEYPPPPPPPTDEPRDLPSPTSFPLPPVLDGYQMKGPEKTLEQRRSSLDAEIDSLTSILADLESSSPYKPRNTQNSGVPAVTSPNAAVTGYKRMVIPTQPPLTATLKSTPKTPAPASSTPPSSASPVPKPQPQPVPASYATASTPSQPTFNVQVRSSQPGPQHQAPGNHPAAPQPARGPAQHRGPDFAFGPPQPGFAPVSQSAYQDQPAYGGPPAAWRPDGPPSQAYPPSGPPSQAYPLSGPPSQAYPPSGPKKTYITDPPASLAPYSSGPLPPHKGPAPRPEEELERLTKKMLFDMDHPPAQEYFARMRLEGGCRHVVGGTMCTGHCAEVGKTAQRSGMCVRVCVCVPPQRLCLNGSSFQNTLEACTICSKPIMERILRATGKAYHPHCFTCVVCQRSLDGIPFTVDTANHIHCIEDFHKKFAPRCCVCSGPIMPAPGQEETVRIVALDRDFHVQCYRCEDCGGLLSEGDNQGCYPLDGHVLCKNCNTSRIQALTAKATTDL
ncbi:lipoma-preferred partner [Hypomesus transpacificus]|uniref:lipoma-preferred partner n=1 Tax=Hypomesus transpacificus TaxID=137520 RepID=UPI001F07CD64|nr:lipoma-preferred partner [Hypomesus transpacificus]